MGLEPFLGTAVTGLALHPAAAERTAGIIRPRVPAMEQVRDRGRVVAAEAGIGPLRAEAWRVGRPDGTRQGRERNDEYPDPSHVTTY